MAIIEKLADLNRTDSNSGVWLRLGPIPFSLNMSFSFYLVRSFTNAKCYYPPSSKSGARENNTLLYERSEHYNDQVRTF